MSGFESELVMRVAGQVADIEVVGLERIPGGRNNRVYRATASSGRKYAIKVYYRGPGDLRDRLETEFRAVSFLWRHGITEIVEPIGKSDVNDIGVYGWVEGRAIGPGEASDRDLAAAVGFLASLKRLSKSEEARSLGRRRVFRSIKLSKV